MASEQDYSATIGSGTETENQTLSVWALTALVVGSMVGAGIFTLPGRFGRSTGVVGALIAWAIAGVGMLMLAFVFQNLAQRKPDLDSGPFMYAKAGFGNYIGFLAALAFWSATCVGNVSYFVLIKSTLGEFLPIFGDGDTVAAIIGSSIIIWLFHVMILRGVQQAAGVNTIVTIAKIVPILTFVFIVLFAFNFDVFTANLLGGEGYDTPLWAQVRDTMLVTVFVFIGIEGASIYSRYAEKRSDVGVATVLGFVGVLALLIMVTLLPYGLLPRAELAELRNPSMAGALEVVVGRWGNAFISIGLLISVLGAFLAWTLFAAEVPFMAAKNNLMPNFLRRENAQKVPATSLWMTNGVVQTFLIITLFAENAFDLALELTSSMALIPYFMVSAYAFKLALTRETYAEQASTRNRELVIALIAMAYAALMLWAAGPGKLLLAALILAPGTILFFLARRQQQLRVFTPVEWFVFTVTAIAAITALVGLVSGQIAF
jgi:arginine:ornithine antiporter/lysine permease